MRKCLDVKPSPQAFCGGAPSRHMSATWLGVNLEAALTTSERFVGECPANCACRFHLAVPVGIALKVKVCS